MKLQNTYSAYNVYYKWKQLYITSIQHNSYIYFLFFFFELSTSLDAVAIAVTHRVYMNGAADKQIIQNMSVCDKCCDSRKCWIRLQRVLSDVLVSKKNVQKQFSDLCRGLNDMNG